MMAANAATLFMLTGDACVPRACRATCSAISRPRRPRHHRRREPAIRLRHAAARPAGFRHGRGGRSRRASRHARLRKPTQRSSHRMSDPRSIRKGHRPKASGRRAPRRCSSATPLAVCRKSRRQQTPLRRLRRHGAASHKDQRASASTRSRMNPNAFGDRGLRHIDRVVAKLSIR